MLLFSVIQYRKKEFEGMAWNDIHLVTDTIENALFSSYPRARYLVGLDARVIVPVVTMLPEWMQDKYLWWVANGIYGKPLPAAHAV